MPREAWTDERLDDFRSDVDRRFDEVDRRFDKVDERFDKLEAKVDAGFAAMNRNLLTASFVLVAGLLAMLGTQL